MDKEIFKLITDYCEEKGFSAPVDDMDAFGYLLESSTIYSENKDEHRWYVDRFNVSEMGGNLIGFYDYYMTGDNSASDMGLDYNPSSACFVEKKEVLVTKYNKIIK